MTHRRPALLPILVGGGLLALLTSGDGRQARSDDAMLHFTLPALDEFWAIVERPLLARSRRPRETTHEAAPAVDDTGAEPVSQIMLVGTATDQGDKAVAILRNLADATEFRVWVGDTVAGWRVMAISPRRLVLARDGTEATVTLAEPLLPQSPAPP